MLSTSWDSDRPADDDHIPLYVLWNVPGKIEKMTTFVGLEKGLEMIHLISNICLVLALPYACLMYDYLTDIITLIKLTNTKTRP